MAMTTWILGISAYYHDSAACLLANGHLIAAAQEERFSRRKGDERFPVKAVEFCLREAGIEASEITAVAYYDKPIMTFGRLLQSFMEYPLSSYALFDRSVPLWLKQKLNIPQLIDTNLPGFEGEILFCRHHESHASSAFFCSPFEEAAIVVIDGVGEWACTSIGEGMANRVNLLKEVRFPHSLGLFYSSMTQYLGFRVNLDEYKVMGLAPYGKPKYETTIRDHLIDLKPDGSIALNLAYFDFPHGLTMINGKLPKLLGSDKREPNEPVTQFHMDVAASVQAITTETVLRLARTAKRLTGHKYLCLAGGSALNCVANGAIFREGLFEDMYIQPAASDAGGAVGAALQVWHQVLGNPRITPPTDLMAGAFLGPRIEDSTAGPFLKSVGADYFKVSRDELPAQVARWLAAGHIIGFCQGRMEFGPRALGARSILGDPRDPENQSRINQKVKFRESFRPFAPAILEDKVQDYFDFNSSSPYMLLVMPVKESRRKAVHESEEMSGLAKLRLVRSDVPAITHVDYSVRLQTVTRERNGIFHSVVSEFYKLTGCPMVVNTSFNTSDEPIVCDHEDAYWCFLMTDLDVLVLDTCVVAKPGVNLFAEPRDFSAPNNGDARD